MKGVKYVIKTVNLLLPGEMGMVIKVTGSGSVKSRLVDMGIVAGSRIKVHKYAPLGDPIEVKVKNFNLSLRKSEATLIEVQTEGSD
jgi:Fe2+ transport system protein FeoA